MAYNKHDGGVSHNECEWRDVGSPFVPMTFRTAMVWVWFDWRAAAVVDEQGQILDLEIWQGRMSIEEAMSRLELLAASALTPEARRLAERFPEARVHPAGALELPEASYPLPSVEEQEIADEAALKLAEIGVARSAGDPDRRLEHLMGATDELRASWLIYESRLVEWVALFIPQARFERDRSALAGKVADSASLAELAESLGCELPEVGPNESEWQVLKQSGERVRTIGRELEWLENASKELATAHLPSLSALLGPLLAARLSVSAHGRMRLARMPAGTLQVLGAEKAFFNHLKTGAPPPKHGHIFMHPWISRSPRWQRGKISRTLASKAIIAARSDAFGGKVWGEEQVGEVEAKVQEIREKYPRANRG